MTHAELPLHHEEALLFSFPIHREPSGPVAHACNTAPVTTSSLGECASTRSGPCPINKTSSGTTSLDIVVMPNCPKPLHFPTHLVADQ